MKTTRKLKVATLMLVIALITILSFLGVYNVAKINGDNLVKDYNVGMELKGKRILRLKVDDTVNEITYDSEGNKVAEEEKEDEGDYTVEEEPVNNPETLTKENYKKAKKIIEDRLNSMDAEEYKIRVNEENGSIELELLDNKLADYIINAVAVQGNFRIVDDETDDTLIDRKLLKSANVVYSSNSSAQTTVYLDIELNKVGAKKLEEISQTYIQTTEQVVNEEGETEDRTVEKEIAVKIDDTSIISTYFGEPLTNGHLYISIGQATTDNEQLQTSALQASVYASVINSDTIPVVYTIEQNDYIISNTNKTIIPIVAIITLVIEAIVLIVIFRVKGIFATVLQLGYIALLLLVIRYTNVYITIEGIIALIISSILNMAFIYRVLNTAKNKESIEKSINDSLKRYISISIPVLIIAIVFCFAKLLEINSFGMVMFWGYVVSLLYSIIFTKGVLKNIM